MSEALGLQKETAGVLSKGDHPGASDARSGKVQDKAGVLGASAVVTKYHKLCGLKIRMQPGVAAHTYKSSTWETEARG